MNTEKQQNSTEKLDMFGHRIDPVTKPKLALVYKSLRDTDVFDYLNGKRFELSERITNLQKNKFDYTTSEGQQAASRNDHYLSKWRHELAAVLRAIHSLGDQQ